MVFTGELGELLDHDTACWHVDTNCKSLGCKNRLNESCDEAGLNDFFHRRNHASVMCCHSRFELTNKLFETQDSKVSRIEGTQSVINDDADLSLLGLGRQAHPSVNT